MGDGAMTRGHIAIAGFAPFALYTLRLILGCAFDDEFRLNLANLLLWKLLLLIGLVVAVLASPKRSRP
jgi:uncharacterized membrane protein YqjE